MYFIRKFREYYFPKINHNEFEKSLEILPETEREIFLKMSRYDIFHSIEVLKKILNTELKDRSLYIRLALLHDCGKESISFPVRVLHKFGFRTKLRDHAEAGYEKMKNIDNELAVLIRNHHKKNYSREMEIFQKCDDES